VFFQRTHYDPEQVHEELFEVVGAYESPILFVIQIFNEIYESRADILRVASKNRVTSRQGDRRRTRPTFSAAKETIAIGPETVTTMI
jgi:hypothetical protein